MRIAIKCVWLTLIVRRSASGFINVVYRGSGCTNGMVPISENCFSDGCSDAGEKDRWATGLSESFSVCVLASLLLSRNLEFKVSRL